MFAILKIPPIIASSIWLLAKAKFNPTKSQTLHTMLNKFPDFGFLSKAKPTIQDKKMTKKIATPLRIVQIVEDVFHVKKNTIPSRFGG